MPYQAIYQQRRQILQLPWQEQLLDGLKQRQEERKKRKQNFICHEIPYVAAMSTWTSSTSVKATLRLKATVSSRFKTATGVIGYKIQQQGPPVNEHLKS